MFECAVVIITFLYRVTMMIGFLVCAMRAALLLTQEVPDYSKMEVLLLWAIVCLIAEYTAREN